jgi:glycosyltransferase involved in cell wall biosynthesis
MRVALVSNLYPPEVIGGYELLARDVAEGLRARGHEVDVLTSGRVAGHEPGVHRVLTLSRAFGEAGPGPGRDRARHLLAARRNAAAVTRYVAARGRPDVVLGMSQRRLGLAPLRALSKHGAQVVVTVNDDWPVAFARTAPRSWKAKLSDVLDRASEHAADFGGLVVRDAIYVSRAIREAVLRSGAPLPRGTVCAQGVDRALFVPGPLRASGPAEPLELLFVGRLHPSKAPDAAIDALAELEARGVPARLTVAGSASDPAYGASLRERAASRGVADRVRWLGQVERDALPGVYRAAHVYLFPNRLETEGQGLTYLEAMSCGVPVVACPTGGARELLDEEVAEIAPSCDGPSLAEAVSSLTPCRVESMCAAAFAMLDERASLDHYVDTLAERLARAASSTPATRARARRRDDEATVASCEDAPRRSACTAW